jgi:hypothetical protein
MAARFVSEDGSESHELLLRTEILERLLSV